MAKEEKVTMVQIIEAKIESRMREIHHLRLDILKFRTRLDREIIKELLASSTKEGGGE